jgi:hypothetical protein
MGHLLDRGDILDLLEESVTSGAPVAVELRGSKHFVDRVSEVVTRDGGDWVIFKDHEAIAVDDIRNLARAQPREPSYSGKR